MADGTSVVELAEDVCRLKLENGKTDNGQGPDDREQNANSMPTGQIHHISLKALLVPRECDKPLVRNHNTKSPLVLKNFSNSPTVELAKDFIRWVVSNELIRDLQ